MISVLRYIVVLAALSGPVVIDASEPGLFQRIQTQTFDKQEFVFPDDLNAKQLNVVFLSMSDDRDMGQHQGEVLLEWHAALEEREFFSDHIVGYHFAVIKAPFFIKGVIRNAMRDNYKTKVPLNQAGILFISDLEEFAGTAGLALDNQPTIVFVLPDGQLSQVFKGEPSEQALDALLKAATEIHGASEATN